jgi:N-carbamoylputrescine amidase
MIIALASPCIASALDEGLDKIKRFLAEASAQGAEIVCFPEAYLPGLRGQDFEVLPFDQTQQERALQAVAQWARMYAVATILGMERLTEAGRQIAAFVIDARGQIQGCQTKNQLDPTEDREGVRLTEWGSSGGPYYEKAMMMRSIENAIYFASVRRARAGHQGRGRNRFARHSIRTRALSRIHVGVSGR